MHQIEVLSRQDELSTGAPPVPQQVVLRRILKIEDLGDRWRGKVLSGIRLKGQWLANAGVHPGLRVAVTVISPGVMELRLIDQSESASQLGKRLPLGESESEAQEENRRPHALSCDGSRVQADFALEFAGGADMQTKE